MRLFRSGCILSALTLALSATATFAQTAITSPEKFFGYQLGADRHMARWDKIVEYYNVLEKESGGRMKVVNMGPTENGVPFLMVYISSAKNISQIETIRKNNLALVHPDKNTSEADIKKIIANGKVVIVQSMSMHATEIGGTQMAPELAYDMLNRQDEDTQRILNNVLFIEVPCFNPDGNIMVADWYNKTLGTPYEGSNYPSLYAKYIGHDDNRDAFQTNMNESKYMASILFTDWRPEVYVDHHHMGSYGARLSLPPYAEPWRPGADPLTWREIAWFGSQMAYKETQDNHLGAINNAIYSGWGHFGFHWITPYHNVDGMLTESASAKLATPMYILPEQLEGGARNLPTYDTETIFPDPWQGGWWHLRQIVEQQKTAAWATMDIAARNVDTVLGNAYQKAIRQTERGAKGSPSMYVIGTRQWDPISVNLMVQKLLVQGIDIEKATQPFTTADGRSFEAGSFVISMAQPKEGLIKNLLDRTFFPDNYWTRNPDGTPIRPYDLSTDTMYEFMGAKVDKVDGPLPEGLALITEAPVTPGKVSGSGSYIVSGKLDESYKVVNQLMAKNVSVARIDKGEHAGDFLVTGGDDVKKLATDTGVDFAAASGVDKSATHPIKRLRIGLYQRYYGGNVDEGWTRWILEKWGFDFKNILDPEIKKGGLNANYDILLFPDDSTSMLTGQSNPNDPGAMFRGNPNDYPAEYRSGLGDDGVAAIKSFVQAGGKVVTLGQASNFAMDKLGVHARNLLAHTSTKDFWCPGSTLKINVANDSSLGYGMPKESLALFLQGDPVFEVLPSQSNEHYEVIASYQDRDILQSGWLVGEGNITKKAAMLSASMGKGKVVLIGFRAQHRAQTYGTFKLFFNSLMD